MQIELSQCSELAAILSIHLTAFGEEGPVIQKLVDDLLKDETASPLVSLVAREDEQIVGHVLFTQAQVEGEQPNSKAAILAPLAVLADYQNQGVGGLLIQQGLSLLAERGVELVFVLGYSAYYNRYGFVTAKPYRLNAPYAIPEEYTDAWMVQELVSGAMEKSEGVVMCANALMQPEHWGP